MPKEKDEKSLCMSGLRHAEYYGMQEVFDGLYAKSSKKDTFTNLMSIILKRENILLAYYNSISFAFTEICGRSYGGGVLEILPGEMGNIMLPKLDDIDEETCRSLLKRIDAIVREDDDIEKALDIVDKEILVDILGIEAEWCEKCRAIWKKMQRRRLGRG